MPNWGYMYCTCCYMSTDWCTWNSCLRVHTCKLPDKNDFHFTCTWICVMLWQIWKVLPTGMNSAILNFLEELDTCTCITLQNINLGLHVFVHVYVHCMSWNGPLYWWRHTLFYMCAFLWCSVEREPSQSVRSLVHGSIGMDVKRAKTRWHCIGRSRPSSDRSCTSSDRSCT